MKQLLTFAILFVLSHTVFSQHNSSKINIEALDTGNLYQKVKEAFIKTDFIVQDLSNRDTLITYPHVFKDIPGYIIGIASIKGKQVEISGVYSFRDIRHLTYQKNKNSMKTITKRKQPDQWKILQKVASLIAPSRGDTTIK